MEITGLTHTSHLWLFFVLVFGIIVLPGMDMVFVIATTLVDGRKAGFAALAGIVFGGMIHVLMSAIGIGVLLKTVPQLFNAMLLAGSAYIAWIGWSLCHGASALAEIKRGTPRSHTAAFGRATLTCLLNPKAYLFMLAVFPQFMRTEYGSLFSQSIVLGAIISLTQIAVYGFAVIAAAELVGWLDKNTSRQIHFGRSVGVLLVLVAIWTGWQGWSLM
jgi:threonine/homoserine/homoserine lactone efflux protein